MTRWSLFIVVNALACSPAPQQACVAGDTPITTDLTQPKVSFKQDVIPVLQHDCALSACHGSTLGTNNGVYLGTPAGSVDASRVYAAIVNAKSGEATGFVYVAPGDLSRSYLQRKVDGDLCSIANQCAKGCGLVMPREASQLDVPTRDVFRRWIAQGAANN